MLLLLLLLQTSYSSHVHCLLDRQFLAVGHSELYCIIIIFPIRSRGLNTYFLGKEIWGRFKVTPVGEPDLPVMENGCFESLRHCSGCQRKTMKIQRNNSNNCKGQNTAIRRTAFVWRRHVHIRLRAVATSLFFLSCLMALSQFSSGF